MDSSLAFWERAGGFADIEQAAAAYINTLDSGAMQAENAVSTNHQHPSAMLCSHKLESDEWQIADCKLMASPIWYNVQFTKMVGIHQGELFSATLSAEFLQMKSNTKYG